MNQTKIVNLGQYHLTSCNYSEAINLIQNSIECDSKKVFIHANYYNYCILKNDNQLGETIYSNSVFFIEGIAMKLAGKLLNWGKIDDINGTDLFPQLANSLSGNDRKIYLIGSRKASIEKAIASLRANFPQIHVAGFSDGYLDLQKEGDIINQINLSGIDLLIVGMGMKRESEFINRNYEILNVKSIWAVGGLFDFISGTLPRAPKFVRAIRMEWLFRLIIEPVKKSKRIFIIFPFFIYDVIKQYSYKK